MTYTTLRQFNENLEAKHGDDLFEKLQNTTTTKGNRAKLAVTALLGTTLNLNGIVKMHTAAFVAINKLGNLLNQAGFTEAAKIAFDVDNIFDTQIYATPLVNNIDAADELNRIIWDHTAQLGETEGLPAQVAFLIKTVCDLTNWAEDECNFKAETRNETRWIEMQEPCNQIRLIAEGATGQIVDAITA